MEHRTKKMSHIARNTMVYHGRRVTLENIEQHIGTSLKTEVVHGFFVGVAMLGKVIAA